jgi:hypothetical protein
MCMIGLIEFVKGSQDEYVLYGKGLRWASVVACFLIACSFGWYEASQLR